MVILTKNDNSGMSNVTAIVVDNINNIRGIKMVIAAS